MLEEQAGLAVTHAPLSNSHDSLLSGCALCTDGATLRVLERTRLLEELLEVRPLLADDDVAWLGSGLGSGLGIGLGIGLGLGLGLGFGLGFGFGLVFS